MPIHTQCHMNTHCVGSLCLSGVGPMAESADWRVCLIPLPAGYNQVRESHFGVLWATKKSVAATSRDSELGSVAAGTHCIGTTGWTRLAEKGRNGEGIWEKSTCPFLQNGRFINRDCRISSVKWYVAHYCSVTLLISFAMSTAGPVHSWSCE